MTVESQRDLRNLKRENARKLRKRIMVPAQTPRQSRLILEGRIKSLWSNPSHIPSRRSSRPRETNRALIAPPDVPTTRLICGVHSSALLESGFVLRDLMISVMAPAWYAHFAPPPDNTSAS